MAPNSIWVVEFYESHKQSGDLKPWDCRSVLFCSYSLDEAKVKIEELIMTGNIRVEDGFKLDGSPWQYFGCRQLLNPKIQISAIETRKHTKFIGDSYDEEVYSYSRSWDVRYVTGEVGRHCLTASRQDIL